MAITTFKTIHFLKKQSSRVQGKETGLSTFAMKTPAYKNKGFKTDPNAYRRTPMMFV